MVKSFNQINPRFRQLTDLLFFSDRMDLDLNNYRAMLREKPENFAYAWDRFLKCSEIFWENGEEFWFNRLSFLLSLNDRALTKRLDEYLETRAFNAFRDKPEVNVKYDIEYLQFVEYCKVKHARHESLATIKNSLMEMPSHINVDKLVSIVRDFTPFIFKDLDEYAGAVAQKITKSARSFELLLALEERGLHFDRQPIVCLVKEIVTVRKQNDKNRRAFFAILNDPKMMVLLKNDYDSVFKDRLRDLLRTCDHCLLEENHLRNFKNVITLDPSFADELAIMYANKLYMRTTGHKKANADRLIRLMKMIPQVVPKKILAYLSSKNNMTDIKYILVSFPELKKLAAFV
jgi:hypothetical protein